MTEVETEEETSEDAQRRGRIVSGCGVEILNELFGFRRGTVIQVHFAWGEI